MAGAPDPHLLADLDAGLLPPGRAERVREAALDDPRSAAVLHALTTTRSELGALGDPPVPAHLRARWTAALHPAAPGDPAVPDDPAAPGPPATPACPRSSGRPAGRGRSGGRAGNPRGPSAGRPGTPRTRPLRRAVRRGVPVVLVTAAALVAGLLLGRSGGPLPISGVELAGVARSTVGLDDLGGLTDPDRRAGCLAAVGAPDSRVAGGRRVSLDGEPGVLLVLTTGELGRFRVLVVDPACGPAGGSVLADRTIGS